MKSQNGHFILDSVILDIESNQYIIINYTRENNISTQHIMNSLEMENPPS